MTNYRRVRIPGAKFFFTVALADRGSDLLLREIDALRRAYALTRSERPFWCDAIVILPDHLHAIWTLPPGDCDFSTRWRLIKSRFVRQSGVFGARSQSKQIKRERGVWQRRFWEHCIRDENDYRQHMAYCWGNPVKHGLSGTATEWPYSSIHRDIRAGRVDPEWTGTAEDGRYGEP